MKKFFGNIYIFIAVLLTAIVAVPFNDFSVWGINYAFLDQFTENEFILKAFVFGFILIFGFIFLLVANREYKKNNKPSFVSTIAVSVPFLLYALSFASYLTYLIYTDTDLSLGIGTSNMNSIYLIAGGAFILLLFIFIHVFIASFRKRANKGRVIYFFFFAVLAAGIGYLAYYFRSNVAVDYAGMSAKYMILYVPLILVLYIIHIMIVRKKSVSESLDSYQVEEDDESISDIILSRDGDISSRSSNMPPSEDLYQEVKVDPEFSKENKLRNKPNSIEYYIEKPKMFKALNPTFDKLVNHVREFPDVITKQDEEKITFYVSRRPFLVLMNYGDYYRLAFRYELEEGIRLIIKYPTISKNKSTREELWFKANNYGDLPKELIYKIVKNAYDTVAK